MQSEELNIKYCLYRQYKQYKMAYTQALKFMNKRSGVISSVTDVDHLMITKSVRGCLIDSLTYKDNVKEGIRLLKSKDTSNVGKLKLGSYFFTGLYGTIRLSDNFRATIINETQEAVYVSELNAILRLYFTTYLDCGAGYSIAKRLISRGVSEAMPSYMHFQILKYALRSPEHDESALTEVILGELEAIFAAEATTIYVKMEIADIFLMNRREERGNEMLNIIRDEERGGAPRVEGITDVTFNTIVSDSQNVHSADVNNSNLRIGVNLISRYGTNDVDMDDIYSFLAELHSEDPELISMVLERIQIDTSVFRFEDNNFSLYNLFCALWCFIDHHEHKADLRIRLVEEMVAMAKYCTTGHLARFISVIQGFSEDPDLTSTISSAEHMKMVIGNLLDTKLATAPDRVLDSIIAADQGPFFAFIETTVTVKLSELISEYGDVRQDICKALAAYTGWKYWIISNEALRKSDEKID
jgi:hypothetical protein